MPFHRASLRAFTLIEIMMVVAIIGLVMTMGVPSILRAKQQEPMRKAVDDMMQICSHARAQAILHGVTMAVVFHPQSKQVALAGVEAAGPPGDSNPSTAGASSLNSTQFADSVIIDMLDVNLLEYKDADEAHVRFFPNGTSDEMTLILHFKDQYRKITLEVTTGLASFEVMR